ncbi:hypothetical protein [Catellatospora sp. NPDC049609]|uniref:hypothetical protein n=1 Tax=Catellatospora sp. NPDC049609 TaxID=3155505 RepID=UPI0034125048
MSFAITPAAPARQDYPYPVVASAALGPARSRLLRGPCRDEREMPEQIPGTVRVFQRNGRYALTPDVGRPLCTPTVTEAGSVAVVSIRQQLVPVLAKLPSVRPERTLVLRARFRCQVDDAVLVLSSGCWSVEPALVHYLLDDTELLMLGAREDAATSPEVARHILARVTARGDLERPEVSGMTIRLVDLDIFTVDEQLNPTVPGTLDGQFHEDGMDGPEYAYPSTHHLTAAGHAHRSVPHPDDGYDDGPPARHQEAQ